MEMLSDVGSTPTISTKDMALARNSQGSFIARGLTEKPVVSRFSHFLINYLRPISGHFRLRKLGMK